MPHRCGGAVRNSNDHRAVGVVVADHGVQGDAQCASNVADSGACLGRDCAGRDP